MATEAQIKANRQNAQHSTGATTEAGAARSSQNSTKHGYTGRTLILKPEEIEVYNVHVASYIADYQPFTLRQHQLVQQKADLDWSLQQISIEQFNTMTHMNVISSQPPDPSQPSSRGTTALTPLFPHPQHLPRKPLRNPSSPSRESRNRRARSPHQIRR